MEEPYLARDRSNRPRNCLSEVWYITFTMLISVMRKYSMLPLVATAQNTHWTLNIIVVDNFHMKLIGIITNVRTLKLTILIDCFCDLISNENNHV